MNHLTQSFLELLEKKSLMFDEDTLSKLKEDIFEIGKYEGTSTLYIKDKKVFVFSDLFIPTDHCDYTYLFSEKLSKICKEFEDERFLKYDYKAQLAHPLWKKRRLEIIKKSDNKCNRCGNEEHLQVHHKKYDRSKLAWEYEDDLLECVCGGCHMKEHNIDKNAKINKLIEDNSTDFDNFHNISKIKALVGLNLNDKTVYHILSYFKLVSLNETNMFFENADDKLYKYLHKKFGDKIIKRQKQIGFELTNCIKETDLAKLMMNVKK
jgi:hypothetical protein